jgi:hypothetical protein
MEHVDTNSTNRDKHANARTMEYVDTDTNRNGDDDTIGAMRGSLCQQT